MFNYSEDTSDDWLWAGGGGYDLAITGDAVFMYCMLSNETFKNLAGLSFDGSWAAPGLTVEDYSTAQTSQPDDLREVGSIVLAYYSVWDYIGDGLGNYTVALKEEMWQNMINVDNWEGSGYKRSGVGTREWFTTATLAMGIVLMMVV